MEHDGECGFDTLLQELHKDGYGVAAALQAIAEGDLSDPGLRSLGTRLTGSEMTEDTDVGEVIRSLYQTSLVEAAERLSSLLEHTAGLSPVVGVASGVMFSPKLVGTRCIEHNHLHTSNGAQVLIDVLDAQGNIVTVALDISVEGVNDLIAEATKLLTFMASLADITSSD